MKTRTKKSTNAVNSLKNKDKSTRKPLSDKTNDANPSNNMKYKKNEKQPTIVTNKIGIRLSQRNLVKSDLTKKNESGNSKVLTSKNEHKLKNNTKTYKSDSSKLKNFNKKTQQEQKNIKNVENTQTDLSVKRRSSRISTVTSNKNSSNLQEKPQQIKEIKKNTTPLKNKRLLDCLKTPSPENSDPYEFKFDPKEEPKQKLKKRGRAKKHVSLDTSESSDEEDNSMKPIVKNIRKNKQKIRVTPVERKLRNRLIKIDDQAGLIPQTNINNIKNSVKFHNADVIEINKHIELNTKENKVINTDAIELNAKSINTSIVDEINEIANTFLEDDDNNISISSPSRIDIISNLIARKTITKPSTKVFNSTMIHETPQQMTPQTQSPWRIEVSTIPRKPLNFCVKNKSFTPSYTPDITNNKKQTTLLEFINRTPNPDLQITLFQNSPTRKPFDNLSNSMSPIHPNRSNISPVKRSDDSLFGFSVLSDSEDKENSPVVSKIVNKLKLKRPDKKQTQFDFKTNESNFKTNEPDFKTNEPDDISIPLFEDLQDVKRNEKRFSRQYTRPQTKRKRNVSFKVCSDDSDSETETHHFKKKQKDVLTKKEAEEAERLASHYNSYFEEIENYPLCIE